MGLLIINNHINIRPKDELPGPALAIVNNHLNKQHEVDFQRLGLLIISNHPTTHHNVVFPGPTPAIISNYLNTAQSCLSKTSTAKYQHSSHINWPFKDQHSDH